MSKQSQTRPSDLVLGQLEQLVAAWYLALDQHVPLEQCNRLLAGEGLRLKFPEGEFRELSGFKQWYDAVINRFFDENHSVQSIEVSLDGEEADLRVVVGWQASWFDPPAAKSRRVSLDATQSWRVRRSTRNELGWEIVTYDATAEPFKYAPGFARLEPPLRR